MEGHRDRHTCSNFFRSPKKITPRPPRCGIGVNGVIGVDTEESVDAVNTEDGVDSVNTEGGDDGAGGVGDKYLLFSLYTIYAFYIRFT